MDNPAASHLEGKVVELSLNPPVKDTVNNLKARVRLAADTGLLVSIEPGMNDERFLGEYFVPIGSIRYVRIVDEDVE